LNIPLPLGGKSVKCPACGTNFQAPPAPVTRNLLSSAPPVQFSAALEEDSPRTENGDGLEFASAEMISKSGHSKRKKSAKQPAVPEPPTQEEEMQVPCPNPDCEEILDLTPSMAGQEAECPTCGEKFVIEGPEGGPTESGSPYRPIKVLPFGIALVASGLLFVGAGCFSFMSGSAEKKMADKIRNEHQALLEQVGDQKNIQVTDELWVWHDEKTNATKQGAVVKSAGDACFVSSETSAEYEELKRSDGKAVVYVELVLFLLWLVCSTLFLIVMFKAWKHVIGWARMSGFRPTIRAPGKAVGFIFIPIFGWYWLYKFYGIGRNLNAIRRVKSIDAPRCNNFFGALTATFAICVFFLRPVAAFELLGLGVIIAFGLVGIIRAATLFFFVLELHRALSFIGPILGGVDDLAAVPEPPGSTKRTTGKPGKKHRRSR
jgi:uncharacterized Zn-finger protein